MTTNEMNPLFDTFEKTDTFDGSLNLYCLPELEARYDYLIELTKLIEPTQSNVQAWSDAHRKEFNTLQDLLYKVPQTDNTTLDMVAERYVQKYCRDLVKTYICTKNTFLTEYIDVDAIANAMIKDLPKVEVNGKVFYWFNCSDF